MRALASDFDGTLFFENENPQFRKKDQKSIKEFQNKGHLFGICTGRPLDAIKDHVRDKICFDFYIVTSGAVILDKNLQIIDEHYISQNLTEKIVLRYEKKGDIAIQANNSVYGFQDSEMNVEKIMIQSLDEIVGHIYGLSLDAHNEDNAKTLCLEINELFPEVEAFQNKQYIDIVKRGCSKGNAILKLKEMFHIDYIAGIGDSYNDISMLESADCAFTFVDSPEVVQNKADQLVYSVSEAIDLLESVSLSEKRDEEGNNFI